MALKTIVREGAKAGLRQFRERLELQFLEAKATARRGQAERRARRSERNAAIALMRMSVHVGSWDALAPRQERPDRRHDHHERKLCQERPDKCQERERCQERLDRRQERLDRCRMRPPPVLAV